VLFPPIVLAAPAGRKALISGLHRQGDHLPAEVLDVLLAEVGVQVVDEEAQVVPPAKPRRHVAPSDAGQQLLDGEAGQAAVGGVVVELGDGAGEGLDAPAAGQAAAASAGGESRPAQS
jgi:hypothetical protein